MDGCMTSLNLNSVRIDIDLSDMESDIENYVEDAVDSRLNDWEENFVPPEQDVSEIENDILLLQNKVKQLELLIGELQDVTRRKSKLRQTISFVNQYISKRYVATKDVYRKSITFLRSKIRRMVHRTPHD